MYISLRMTFCVSLGQAAKSTTFVRARPTAVGLVPEYLSAPKLLPSLDPPLLSFFPFELLQFVDPLGLPVPSHFSLACLEPGPRSHPSARLPWSFSVFRIAFAPMISNLSLLSDETGEPLSASAQLLPYPFTVLPPLRPFSHIPSRGPAVRF